MCIVEVATCMGDENVLPKIVKKEAKKAKLSENSNV